MANKNIIAIFLVILVVISLIIAIPVLTFSSSFSNYGRIDELLIFEYAPDNSSPIEKFNLNIDMGNVEIKYVTTPVDYYVKIQVDIEMMGHLFDGKKYSDYFSVEWDITSPSPTFTMLCTSDTWFDPSLLLTQNVDIIITLNAIILFDINITINEEGNVHLIVPFAVTTNNVEIYTNEGDILCDFHKNCTLEGNITGIANEGNILYDFQYCTLEGNITGIANDGNIELKAYNPEYTRNITWTCNSIAGDITININHNNQYNIMNANITGSLVGNEFGDIIVYYYDNTANIGAMITLNDTKILGYGSDWDGFENEVLKDLEGEAYGFQFTSTDFPTINNYNLLLVGVTLDNYNEGMYEVHLSSS